MTCLAGEHNLAWFIEWPNLTVHIILSYGLLYRNTVKPVIREHLKTVKPVIREHLNTVKPVTRGQLKTVKPVIREHLNTVKPVIRGQLNTVKPVTRGQLNTVKPVIRGQLNTTDKVYLHRRLFNIGNFGYVSEKVGASLAIYEVPCVYRRFRHNLQIAGTTVKCHTFLKTRKVLLSLNWRIKHGQLQLILSLQVADIRCFEMI